MNKEKLKEKLFTMAILAVLIAFVFNFVLLHMNVRRLQKQVVGNSPEGWHRTQMNLWCKEAEEKNPGWICPNPYIVNVPSNDLETVYASQEKE